MSGVKKYRKRPVVIDTMHWDGTAAGAVPIIQWIHDGGGDTSYTCLESPCTGDSTGHTIQIRTLEGPITASAGDYIIKGVQGEFYPIKESIFRETYEPVEES